MYVVGTILNVDDVETDCLHLRRSIIREAVSYASVHRDLQGEVMSRTIEVSFNYSSVRIK